MKRYVVTMTTWEISHEDEILNAVTKVKAIINAKGPKDACSKAEKYLFEKTGQRSNYTEVEKIS